MTRLDRILPDVPATRDLHVRLMMGAVLNGQFDGVPLNLFSKVDWVDAAQWLADVEGEPEDEAQAIAEIELMLRKSAWEGDYERLSEREQDDWQGFENYASARNADRTQRTMEVGNLIVGQFCADMLSGVRL